MTSVDPRIEDRRDGVRRQRRRTLTVRLGLVCCVALLVAAAFGLTRSPFLDVDRVTITGGDQVTATSIMVAAEVAVGDPMTDIDLGGAEGRLESLPWVATAAISREWPSTVTIELTERTPIAVVTTQDGGLLAVDIEGRVLQEVDEPGELLSLGGVAAAELGEFVDAAPLLEVAAAMPVELSRRISGATWEASEVELALLPSGTVRFGPISHIEDKFLALRTVLAQVDQRCLAGVDLRVARRPTVVREPACSSPEDVVVDDVTGPNGELVDTVTGTTADTDGSVDAATGPDVTTEEPLSDSGFPIHPDTGLPYDPAVGMQWDPVTGQPVDPATGEGYDPPPLG